MFEIPQTPQEEQARKIPLDDLYRQMKPKDRAIELKRLSRLIKILDFSKQKREFSKEKDEESSDFQDVLQIKKDLLLEIMREGEQDIEKGVEERDEEGAGTEEDFLLEKARAMGELLGPVLKDMTSEERKSFLDKYLGRGVAATTVDLGFFHADQFDETEEAILDLLRGLPVSQWGRLLKNLQTSNTFDKVVDTLREQTE